MRLHGDAKETQVEKMGVNQLYYKICLLPVHNYDIESWALELDGPLAVSQFPHL